MLTVAVVFGLISAFVAQPSASAQSIPSIPAPTSPPSSEPETTAPLPTTPLTTAPVPTTPQTVTGTFPTSSTVGPMGPAPTLTPGSTTTAPPGSTTTTTTVPADPKPGTNPEADPVGNSDAPSEAVPDIAITVPPRRQGDPMLNGSLPGSKVIIGELSTARGNLAAAETIRNAAAERVAQLEADMAAGERKISGFRSDEIAKVQEFATLRKTMANRTADAYIGALTGADTASVLIGSTDANDYGRRRQYILSVIDNLSASARKVDKTRRELGPNLLSVADRQVHLALELDAARVVVQQTSMLLLTAAFAVQVFAAGSEIFVNGFVFPVADPHNFINSYGAPREVGNADFHYHEGTDIMTVAGNPLFAAERGVISKVSSGHLGGNSLWVKGESNTSYYYAHLSSYADGMALGKVVEAGAVVGYAGTTGNAAGGAPHLHFEIHPNGGPAINPYPLLKVIDDVGHGRPPVTAPR